LGLPETSAAWVRHKVRLEAARLATVMSILSTFGAISCHPGGDGSEALLEQMLASSPRPVACPPGATESGDTAHRFFRHTDGDSSGAEWRREISAWLGSDGQPHTIWISMYRQQLGTSGTGVVLHGRFDASSLGVVELMKGAEDSIAVAIDQGRRGDTVSSEVAARVREFAAGIWSNWCARGR